MTRTAIRATDLPLPTAVEGGVVSTGTGQYIRNVREVAIADHTLFIDGAGTVFRACGRCYERAGRIQAFGHVFSGICFECNGAGIRHYAPSVAEAQAKVRKAQAADARRAAKEEAERPAREAAAAKAWAETIERAHALALEDDAEWEAKQARLAAQRFAGEVGGKVTVIGKVVKNLSVEGNFNGRKTYSRLVIVEGAGDDAGVTVKTFGTSEWHYAVEEGDEVVVTATVKAHETYRGTKQTVIIRPKGK